MNREEIIDIIVNFLVMRNIVDNTKSIDLDASLSKLYGIDSLGLVDIIIYCEESFGFEFDYTELDLNNFESINILVNLIDKHI